MTFTTFRHSLLAMLCGAALAGCATAPETKKEAKSDADEYEWVVPNGSHIAVKVKKGQTAQVGGSPTGTMTGEQMQSAVHSSAGAKPAGGN